MKFIFCHIENFGRLRNFDYRFADGLNTILHENGWGKSTFAAFLCAMLYGLPAARKKNPAENERLKFRPWQGGVYGGTLLFEAGGRNYEISRVFGTRESEDVFELRDVETNLPCFDFSAKTGEELFHLDRDSFLRTVFTGQQDCATSATDDVNALVAALEEQAGDMSEFSAAMKRLTDAANRLSPLRQSGSVARRAKEITRLERETSRGEEPQGRIRELEELLREAGEEETRLNGTLLTLEEKIEGARREEDDRRRDLKAAEADAAARSMRDHLLGQLRSRRRDVLSAAAVFPGRVPARREVDRYLDLCRQMDRLEEQMQNGQLSAREQKRLTELEDLFPEEMPLQDRESLRGKKLSLCFVVAAGILLAAAGAAAGLVYGSRVGAGLAAAGAVTAVSAAAVYFGRGPAAAGYTKTAAGHTKDAAGHTKDAAGYTKAAAGDKEDAYLQEYAYLREKEQRLETIHARWSEIRRPVLQFLHETESRDVPGDEDLYARLIFLRDAADDYEDAVKLLREARDQLRSLGKGPETQEMRMAQTSASNIPAGELLKDDALYRILALQQKKADTLAELAECRRTAAENRRILEELQTQQGEQEENLQNLRDLRVQQEADTLLYRRITLAAKYLQKAKESMSARYADPIRERFAYYWEMITGLSAVGVYVDADSNVTVEEAGKQREAALLSEGYRDLTGICLRAALGDAMYPEGRTERPPLILDDPFVNLDDGKMEGALCFLRELSEKYQILYFTCSHSRAP
ncbi:MAG: AAA family ATPase [Lachnospiraceae bacterium]|nr:AAA family ATPase [Lachnospiraceae bacterium]